MVDSVNPSGAGQNVPGVSKTQDPQRTQPRKENSEEKNAPVDQIILSDEALSLSQAEDAARAISKALSRDQEAVLSKDQARLSTLV
ncbi:MAG: hypothetical protein KDI90_06375 [Alphaproteobacteria bacterium]|nr:hypothetical protein [Alphaproteobacteria bacterium]MCB9974560.1 hypothetical protein [Rhodospirillales bacterium]